MGRGEKKSPREEGFFSSSAKNIFYFFLPMEEDQREPQILSSDHPKIPGKLTPSTGAVPPNEEAMQEDPNAESPLSAYGAFPAGGMETVEASTPAAEGRSTADMGAGSGTSSSTGGDREAGARGGAGAGVEAGVEAGAEGRAEAGRGASSAAAGAGEVYKGRRKPVVVIVVGMAGTCTSISLPVEYYSALTYSHIAVGLVMTHRFLLLLFFSSSFELRMAYNSGCASSAALRT